MEDEGESESDAEDGRDEKARPWLRRVIEDIGLIRGIYDVKTVFLKRFNFYHSILMRVLLFSSSMSWVLTASLGLNRSLWLMPRA